MKRLGKCVGKKTFAFIEQAEAQVIRNFVYGNKTLGIYECPTCLDFHTTSKYDNRSRILSAKCKRIKTKYFYLLPDKRADYLNRRVMSHIRGPKKKKEKQVPKLPTTDNQERKRKKAEYKKSIIPLSEQKRILAELDNKKLSTHCTFLNWIRGIINCKVAMRVCRSWHTYRLP